MKNLENGKTQKTLFFFLSIAFVALACQPARALTSRSLWVFEQLLSSPNPSTLKHSRNKLALSGTNLSDSYSTQATLLVDLSLFELEASFSQRLFRATSDEGVFLKSKLFDERQTIAIKLAKYFQSENHHFGRFAGVFLQFLPTNRLWWVGFTVDAGILETPESPWRLELNIRGLMLQDTDQNILLIGGQTARAIYFTNSTLYVGGSIQWSYHLFQDPKSTGEHMLFSIGPVVQWDSALGLFKLIANWRIWIDRDFLPSGALSHPSELSYAPDVALSWTVSF